MVNRQMAERCVELLNEMIESDPEAVSGLCSARIPCNEALADHPTVQVGPCPSCSDDPQVDRVGLLGVLNGICGAYDDGPRKGWGAVAVVFQHGRVIEARLLENEP